MLNLIFKFERSTIAIVWKSFQVDNMMNGRKPWNSSGEELKPLLVGKLWRGGEERNLEKEVFGCVLFWDMLTIILHF